MKIALKEWNATIEALGQGQIIALWRKGGIDDSESLNQFESFQIETTRFVLFPTFTHQSQEKIKKDFWPLNTQTRPNSDNQITVKYWAELEQALTPNSLEEVLSISGELANTKEHLISSWNRSPHQTGKILLIRVYELTNPILITNSPKYGGCKSWIELSVDIPKIGSKPVLSFRDFQSKARLIKSLLEQTQKKERIIA